MADETTVPFWLMLTHYDRKKEKKIPLTDMVRENTIYSLVVFLKIDH